MVFLSTNLFWNNGLDKLSWTAFISNLHCKLKIISRVPNLATDSPCAVSWWRHLCGEFTGPGEFPAQRPVTRSFDVFFDLHPNKRLSKQWWGWWFEAPSWSLWRQSNVRPWVNQSLHVWWSTSVENDIYCVSLVWRREIFYKSMPLFVSLCITHIFPIIFFLSNSEMIFIWSA